jgi:hypothetical protein
MKIINIIAKAGFILVLLVFIACQKEESIKNPVATRTIIAYFAADNDLYFDAFESLQQMEEGFTDTGVNLIVFFDQGDGSPCLAEVHPPCSA